MVERLCTEQGEIHLFLLPGGLLVCELCRARLARVFTDGKSSPWKPVAVAASWKEFYMGLGSW